MALSREQKRMLRKQGELGDDGEPVRKARTAPKATAPKQERTTVKQYVREVRAEPRKVAWPTREETINYSVIVLVTLVLLTTLIFVLDFVFSEAILRLFDAQ